ncbi:phosphoesterase [Sulfolobus acidocaldarius SUSAZ]|nr:phosphoesterase [Sulfolobus acidocaldarius SUSAZ]
MKIDFHVHSFFSDGRESPLNIIKYALRIGLDAIALTDHDTSKGYYTVKDYPVIPGQEVTTEFGHVVILCNFPPSPPREIAKLVDYAKDNNCIVFPSHPFDIFRAGIGKQVYEYKFNAIEVYNSKAPKNANDKALAVSKNLNLPGLANSDAHVIQALGSAYNYFKDISEFNIDNILEHIRKSKIEISPLGLNIKAKIKIIEWSILRKLKIAKNTSRVMYQVQGT